MKIPTTPDPARLGLTLARPGSLLLLLASLTLGACGGSDRRGGGGRSDREQITLILQDAGRDPTSLCDHLTAAALRASFQGSAAACHRAAAAPGAGGHQVRVVSVVVRGASAVARASTQNETRSFLFVKANARWRLDRIDTVATPIPKRSSSPGLGFPSGLPGPGVRIHSLPQRKRPRR